MFKFRRQVRESLALMTNFNIQMMDYVWKLLNAIVDLEKRISILENGKKRRTGKKAKSVKRNA
jgi:hypothetical protein